MPTAIYLEGLWAEGDGNRSFLFPEETSLRSGPMHLVSVIDRSARFVDSEFLPTFEVTEQEALQWAREELGATLEELKAGIGEVLAAARSRLDERNHAPVGERTTVTAEAGPALLGLLGKLPGVIGNSLSGDAERVAKARETLAGLDGRLRDAGIKLDERFTGFADRLADLREQPPPRA